MLLRIGLVNISDDFIRQELRGVCDTRCTYALLMYALLRNYYSIYSIQYSYKNTSRLPEPRAQSETEMVTSLPTRSLRGTVVVGTAVHEVLLD